MSFLSPNVQVEPLFDSWYAWSHLIPPATAARNVTERHLKIMSSYITAPHIHANAVKDPKLLGGPFIDYGGERVDEIAALKQRTEQDLSHLVLLSEAISELDFLLRSKAKGFALGPLYAEVPQALRGYVELAYDLNNHPSFRILERLLYRSQYYDRRAQTLMLSAINADDRPFVLSTPRLDSESVVQLNIPFDDERVDWMFELKRRPKPWDEIVDRFEIPASKHKVFEAMFTEEPPVTYAAYGGPGLRWRYFGHACILLETANVTILFDPVLSYTYESTISRYTYDDLPDSIDFVVITHNHQDHILFETLLQIRHKVKTFVVPPSGSGALQDPSVRLLLEQVGCSNVIEINEMEQLPFDGGSLMGIPFIGEHADLNIRSKLAFLVRLGRTSLLFMADSCNLEPLLYQHIHREIGDVDVLFLGMECDGAPLTWLYGPLLTQRFERSMDRSRRLAGCDYEQAIGIVSQFGCKEVYVYAMGQEPWLNHVMSIKYTLQSQPIMASNQLIRECHSRGIAAERLFGEKEILLSIRN